MEFHTLVLLYDIMDKLIEEEGLFIMPIIITTVFCCVRKKEYCS